MEKEKQLLDLVDDEQMQTALNEIEKDIYKAKSKSKKYTDEKVGGITKESIGLDKVDNTPDSEKNVATAKVADNVSNPNLLDNWDFRNPINQRGEKEYSEVGYTIDRWKLSTDNLKLSIDNDYIRIHKQNLTANPYFSQIIENADELLGKTVTVSVLYKSNDNVRFTIYDNQTIIIPVSEDWNLAYYTFILKKLCSNSPFWLQFRSDISIENNYFDIKAVKLELGDRQTLAHQDENGEWVLNDPPPNPALELAKCQRYQVKLDFISGLWERCVITNINNNSFDVFVPLTVTPRISPAIESITSQINSNNKITFDGVTNYDGWTCTLAQSLSNGVMLRFAKESHGINPKYVEFHGCLFDFNL